LQQTDKHSTPHPIVSAYNTLTKTTEPLLQTSGRKLNLFVCGPTVYDQPHLGHAKTYIQFDFIVKYLRHRGYDVFYLQNITDIDDKIIRRAQREQMDWRDLARQFEEVYLQSMAALGNTAVDKYARATEYIDQIVTQVQTLMSRGFAYSTSDGIYFDLSRFANYGKLSGRTELNPDDAVSRIDESREKRNPGDFCLWKGQKPDEPFWDTVLGPGRPGWHIEDTAITESHFGPQYDVHGGAVDLIFPHHEAEIAQMECASGRQPLVRYWLHTAFLNINKKKMSKSVGNIESIPSALAKHDYRAIRFSFLRNHYRTAIDLHADFFSEGEAALNRLAEFVFSCNSEPSTEEETVLASQALESVCAALDDDFNTARAFGIVFEYVRYAHASGLRSAASKAFMAEINRIFEILNLSTTRNDTDADINALVAERDCLRGKRQYAEADAIRVRLNALGVQVYDSKNEVRWRRLE